MWFNLEFHLLIGNGVIRWSMSHTAFTLLWLWSHFPSPFHTGAGVVRRRWSHTSILIRIRYIVVMDMLIYWGNYLLELLFQYHAKLQKQNVNTPFRKVMVLDLDSTPVCVVLSIYKWKCVTSILEKAGFIFSLCFYTFLLICSFICPHMFLILEQIQQLYLNCTFLLLYLLGLYIYFTKTHSVKILSHMNRL